jgi:hypothetical protein
MGDLNPHDDDFWLLLHNLPLAEQDRRHAAIIYPESESEQVIQHGVLPILRERFGLPIEAYPGCIQCFCMATLLDHTFGTYRFMPCTQTASAPVTITCRHATLCITVYPSTHDRPILIHDGMDVYTVPERVIPGHWIDDDSESESSPEHMEMASMAISGSATASAFALLKKDPSLEDIGDPCNLSNYLPDSGATQHMTPRLGVEVADGHIIKCSNLR